MFISRGFCCITTTEAEIKTNWTREQKPKQLMWEEQKGWGGGVNIKWGGCSRLCKRGIVLIVNLPYSSPRSECGPIKIDVMTDYRIV